MLSATRGLSPASAIMRGIAFTVVVGVALSAFVIVLVVSPVIAAVIPERALFAEPLPELIYEQDATTGVIAVLDAVTGNRVHTIPVPFGLDATGGGVTFDCDGNLYAAYTSFVPSGGTVTTQSTTGLFAGPRPWISAPGYASAAGFGAGEIYLAISPFGTVATVALPFRLGLDFVDILFPSGRQLFTTGNGITSLAYLSDGTLLFSGGINTMGTNSQLMLVSIAPGATTFEPLFAIPAPGLITTDGKDDVFIYSQVTATQGTVTELHFPGASVVTAYGLEQSAGVAGIVVSRSGRRLYLLEPGTTGTTTLGYDLATGGGEPILNHYEPKFIGSFIAIRL
jgi:hypothetical protein